MTIKITQTCDGCGRDRRLPHESERERSSWMIVRRYTEEYDLCGVCLSNALGIEPRKTPVNLEETAENLKAFMIEEDSKDG